MLGVWKAGTRRLQEDWHLRGTIPGTRQATDTRAILEVFKAHLSANTTFSISQMWEFIIFLNTVLNLAMHKEACYKAGKCISGSLVSLIVSWHSAKKSKLHGMVTQLCSQALTASTPFFFFLLSLTKKNKKDTGRSLTNPFSTLRKKYLYRSNPINVEKNQ